MIIKLITKELYSEDEYTNKLITIKLKDCDDYSDIVESINKKNDNKQIISYESIEIEENNIYNYNINYYHVKNQILCFKIDCYNKELKLYMSTSCSNVFMVVESDDENFYNLLDYCFCGLEINYYNINEYKKTYKLKNQKLDYKLDNASIKVNRVYYDILNLTNKIGIRDKFLCDENLIERLKNQKYDKYLLFDMNNIILDEEWENINETELFSKLNEINDINFAVKCNIEMNNLNGKYTINIINSDNCKYNISIYEKNIIISRITNKYFQYKLSKETALDIIERIYSMLYEFIFKFNYKVILSHNDIEEEISIKSLYKINSQLNKRVDSLENGKNKVILNNQSLEREIDYIKKKSIILEEQLKVLDKSPNNYNDPFLDLNILNNDPYIDFSKYYMMEVYNNKTVNDILEDNQQVINYYKKIQKTENNPNWYKYNEFFSNIVYLNSYAKTYYTKNLEFYNEIFNRENIDKISKIKLAIVGGGSGLDVIALEQFLVYKNKKLNLNVDIIDNIVWPVHFFSHKYKKIDNLTIKKMSLENFINYEEYYDIVIYSRILNYTEFNNSEMLKNKNEYLDKICKRNDKYKYAIQVINKNTSQMHFENDMLTYTNEEKLCCEEGGLIHKLLLLK